MGYIGFYILNQHQSQILAIFGNIAQPGANRRVRAVEGLRFAVNTQFPFAAGTVRLAKNAHHQLGASGSHRAAEGEDFTFTQIERNIINHFNIVIFGVIDRPVFYFHDRFARRGFTLGEAVG